MSIQIISDIIYDNKEKLTDNEYKIIMDNLMILNKYTDDLELKLTREFMEQFFYHSHLNNPLFLYIYCNHDLSLRVMYKGFIKYLKIGELILFEKYYNTTTKEYLEIKGKVEKIMPKYSVISFDDTNRKKMSNITLCKISFYPYITVE